VRDPRDAVPMHLRAAVVLRFLREIEARPDPDEWFLDWVSTYWEGEDDFIRWAQLSWREVRSWNWQQREEQRAIVQRVYDQSQEPPEEFPF
jgi:hypothetical protein